MIGAVDTNIFLDLLRPNPEFVDQSLRLLERESTVSRLVISNVVYAELAANFSDRQDLDRFLRSVPAAVEHMASAASFEAGRAWLRYRAAGGTRDRILADFLIGAHALHHASRLLSRDRGFFRTCFPTLEVVES